jgi:hypothetical protein
MTKRCTLEDFEHKLPQLIAMVNSEREEPLRTTSTLVKKQIEILQQYERALETGIASWRRPTSSSNTALESAMRSKFPHLTDEELSNVLPIAEKHHALALCLHDKKYWTALQEDAERKGDIPGTYELGAAIAVLFGTI